MKFIVCEKSSCWLRKFIFSACLFLSFLLYSINAYAYTQKHGYVPVSKRFIEKLEVDKSTKETVKSIIGVPILKDIIPSESVEVWYYAEVKVDLRPFFGNSILGGSSIKLTFDKNSGLLKKIEKMPLHDNIAGVKNMNTTQAPFLLRKTPYLNPKTVLDIRKINMYYDPDAVSKWMKKIDMFKKSTKEKVKAQEPEKQEQVKVTTKTSKDSK